MASEQIDKHISDALITARKVATSVEMNGSTSAAIGALATTISYVGEAIVLAIQGKHPPEDRVRMDQRIGGDD